ncbi:MAG: hypothetical protein AAFX58_11760, partial [Pseudomonadota bacterium]
MTEHAQPSVLKAFSPLDSLKRDNLTALAKKTRILELNQGEYLFKQGDTEKRTMYVVSGAVDLVEDGTTADTVRGGSDEARNPLSPILPRRFAARASTKIQYLSIDSDLLDVMLTWDQTGSYEVSELRGEAGGVSSD